MRKLALVLGVSIFLVAGGTAAGSQVPETHAGANQYALAEWKTTENGNRVIYFAAGINQASGPQWPFTGYVGRAECKRVDRGHHAFMRCTGRAQPAQLAPGDFVVDPALQSASLRLVLDDVTHTVSWEATGDTPKPYFHQHAGTDVGFQVMSSMGRRALATGTLFGQELEASRRGYLVQGAMVDVYLNERFDIGHFHFRDGTLFFRRTFGA